MTVPTFSARRMNSYSADNAAGQDHLIAPVVQVEIQAAGSIPAVFFQLVNLRGQEYPRVLLSKTLEIVRNPSYVTSQLVVPCPRCVFCSGRLSACAFCLVGSLSPGFRRRGLPMLVTWMGDGRVRRCDNYWGHVFREGNRGAVFCRLFSQRPIVCVGKLGPPPLSFLYWPSLLHCRSGQKQPHQTHRLNPRPVRSLCSRFGRVVALSNSGFDRDGMSRRAPLLPMTVRTFFVPDFPELLIMENGIGAFFGNS